MFKNATCKAIRSGLVIKDLSSIYEVLGLNLIAINVRKKKILYVNTQ